MNDTDQISIALSRTKTLVLIAGALGFVAGGAWMFQLDAAYIAAQHRFNSPMLVHGIGLVSIVFFGLCAVVGLRKLVDKRPGLVLNHQGIFDNTSGVSAGLVPWSDIIGFATYQIQGQKMLIVQVSNPDKYIEVGSTLRRKLNRANHAMCGSPIAMTANSLQIGFDDLLATCNQFLARHQHRH